MAWTVNSSAVGRKDDIYVTRNGDEALKLFIETCAKDPNANVTLTAFARVRLMRRAGGVIAGRYYRDFYMVTGHHDKLFELAFNRIWDIPEFFEMAGAEPTEPYDKLTPELIEILLEGDLR